MDESLVIEKSTVNSYQQWQEVLLKRFFTPQKAMRRVRLDIDADDFPINGCSIPDLIAAVQSEVATDPKSHHLLELAQSKARLFRRNLREHHNSEGETPIQPPDVLPVLALLILACHHGGDNFAGNNYYDRLMDLVGHTGIEPLSSKEMRGGMRAWEALESWSCQIVQGQRGMFEVRVLGGNRFVGVPLRQALLSPIDETAIEMAFTKAGLEPGRLPSTARLCYIAQGANLRARPKRLAAEFPTTLASRELIDDIGIIFDEWHPSLDDLPEDTVVTRPLRISFSNQGETIVRPKLMACFHDEDEVTSLRFNPSSPVYPESGPGELHALDRDGSSKYVEISDPDGDSDFLFDLNWMDALTLEASHNQLKIELKRDRRDFLLFEQMEHDWIEVQTSDLTSGRSYLELRCKKSLDDKPSWGSGSFIGPKWIAVSGMSDLFLRMFKYESIEQQRKMSGGLALKGGIRTNPRGFEYFDFGLPTLVWSHVQSPEIVLTFLNKHGGEISTETVIGDLVHKDSDQSFGQIIADQRFCDVANVFVNLPANQNLVTVIEARLAQENKSNAGNSIRFFVQNSSDPILPTDPPPRNSWGELDAAGTLVGRVCQSTNSSITGSFQMGMESTKSEKTGRAQHIGPPNRVCRLLRSRVDIPWQKARGWLAACGEHGSFSDRHRVIDAVKSLHILGTLELVEDPQGGFERVLCLPPRISITSREANLGLGLRGGMNSGKRYMLSGAWLPEEVDHFFKFVSRTEGLIWHVEPTTRAGSLIHDRRSIIAETEDEEVINTLEIEAHSRNVQFEKDIPDALSSLSGISSLEETCDSLDWRPGIPGAGYEVRAFDPIKLCIADPEESTPHRYRLLECCLHDRPIWKHFVVDLHKNLRAEVRDRQLGRWIVRKHAVPNSLLPTDQSDLILPVELRLPLHVERAFCLDSGQAPSLSWYKDDDGTLASPFHDKKKSQQFDIPPPPPIHRLSLTGATRRHGGAFYRYRGAHNSCLWKRNEPMPFLGLHAKSISAIGLEH